MEYSLMKLLVETMVAKRKEIDNKYKNNDYVIALNEFIAAAKKLMKFM